MNKEYLNEFFSYESDGGLVRVKNSPHSRMGKLRGHLRGDGYIRVHVSGRLYYLHRLVWMFFNGEIADGFDIDHINRNRSDNRVTNLRLAKRYENSQNISGARSTSKTGIVGVCLDKRSGKYVASISIKRKFYKKLFLNKKEAGDWYLDMKRKIHEFNML